MMTIEKVKRLLIDTEKQPFYLAGETRLEHATGGFGDRCSTN